MTIADLIKEANVGQYLEKEIVSKRFILAVLIVGYYLSTGDATAAALVGSVMGFYFGEKAATKSIEVQE